MEAKKIIIITGANSGLSLSCALNIVRTSSEYRIILPAISQKKRILMKPIRTLLIICCILSANITLAQEKTLTYTDHEPFGGMRTNFIKEAFFSAIEKESNGHLKIEAHWNGELSNSYDALRTVSGEGIADMAIVVPEYSPEQLPLHQIFKSFPVGPSGDQQLDFFHRIYADIPDFSEELENSNVVNLLFCTGYPVAFFSADPLTHLDDIRETKWRSASFWHRDFLKNAGAIPVSMPWNDGIYKALQAGTLNGLMVNMDSGYDLKIHEVAPNILVSKDLWLGHVYLLVMNKNTWNGLLKEEQEAILRAAKTAYKSLDSMMSNSFDVQIEDLKNDGANVRILEPAEVEQWKTDTDYTAVQSTWVKEQQDKGLKNIDIIMKKVSSIMGDFIR